METFSLDLGLSWWRRLVGRNPLVRTSDRIEAMARALAVVVVLMAVPCVGAFATEIREARATSYELQAIDRHETAAVAVADSRLHSRANGQSFDVLARWVAEDGVHVDVVPVADVVRAGDHVGLWVDARGRRVDAPTPSGRASTEAVGWAVLSWSAVAATAALAVHGLRRRLTSARYLEWDRALEALAGGGGRTSH